MRVYVPATLRSLARLLDDGSLEVAAATTVTEGLRAAVSGTTDEEELELEALLDAAELSFGLLATDREAPRRRVVLAADLADTRIQAQPDLGPAVVRLTGPVSLASVVSAHVDEAGVESRVEAGDVEDLDLLWYDASELADLLTPAPPPTPS